MSSGLFTGQIILNKFTVYRSVSCSKTSLTSINCEERSDQLLRWTCKSTVSKSLKKLSVSNVDFKGKSKSSHVFTTAISNGNSINVKATNKCYKDNSTTKDSNNEKDKNNGSD